MGNSSTSGNGGNLSGNDSLDEGQSVSEFLGLFGSSMSSSSLRSQCHTKISMTGVTAFIIFILLTATPANVGLMWLLLRRRRTMNPSELLGLNVSIIDILYCLYLPLDIYTMLHQSSEAIHSLQEAFITLNLFGCPLLLTCMCVERYVAVACPLAYMRVGRWWGYRLALCAWVWALTLAVALLGSFSQNMVRFYLSVTLVLLFLVMLLCLLGIVAALRRSGPGEVSRTSVPLKQRALRNVMVVMVPSVVAYSPVVALVLYVLVYRSTQCHILSTMLLFPNVGLFIGPTFYLSRIRQMSCCSKDQHSPNTRTQKD